MTAPSFAVRYHVSRLGQVHPQVPTFVRRGV
jgi:hypothetical protein